MGFYRRFEAGMADRAGYAVAQYDGWPLSNIIREYAFNHDLTIENERLELRRAMLVSYEANCLVKNERFAL